MTHVGGNEEAVGEELVISDIQEVGEGGDPLHEGWQDIRLCSVVGDTADLGYECVVNVKLSL